MPARQPCAFLISLRGEAGGRVLAHEPVTRADLKDSLSEFWFNAYLRRGFPEVPLGEVRAEMHPVYLKGGQSERSCAGFALRSRNGAGDPVESVFPRPSLEHVAVRGSRRMIETGVLEAGDDYYYDLEYSGDGAGTDGLLVGPDGCPAPEVLRTPLAPLLRRAEPVGVEQEKDSFPVIYRRHALEMAEIVSRRGGSANPPEETGGMLVGRLFSCPETGEMFALVDEVLEAAHATGTTYQLTYSGKTWARIQAIMDAKRAHPETQGSRILGQAHGHSFIPFEGVPPCAACSQLAVCTRSSAFLSADDRSWCRAIFHGEPWQLSHIFGLNARNEPVERFFGQKHGELAPRGYYVIDDATDLISKGGNA